MKLCLLSLAALLLFMGSAEAQWGCTSGSPCVNPLAATDLTGDWTDSYSSLYVLTSSAGTVTGSYTTPNPYQGLCPDSVWTVSGSLTPVNGTSRNGQYTTNGYTTLAFTAANPNPAGTCYSYTPAASIDFSGILVNDGNDVAPVSASYHY